MDSHASAHSANGVNCGLLLANEALMMRANEALMMKEGAEHPVLQSF
jgi:hypothetical protein